jgi:hypothetical protein
MQLTNEQVAFAMVAGCWLLRLLVDADFEHLLVLALRSAARRAAREGRANISKSSGLFCAGGTLGVCPVFCRYYLSVSPETLILVIVVC